MKLRNKTINSKAVAEHTRKIFTLTQPLPSPIISLLH